MEMDLQGCLLPGISLTARNGYYEVPMLRSSDAIAANAFYFSQEDWTREYFDHCHRDEAFRQRWSAATGSWDDKIVLDIGCGPGNVHATLGHRPKLLVGVDVAGGALTFAAARGYTAVLADAHSLPFRDGFADIVAVNASLHHCDDMEAVLNEAARMVAPGGLLVTDHDPQLSAWDYRGLAKMLWDARIRLYRATQRGFHKSNQQQSAGLATEIHHRPGHGVTERMFKDVLEPMKFDVRVFAHNHEVGAEALDGRWGRAAFKYQLDNALSGRNPYARRSALSLMCVARRAGQAAALPITAEEPEQPAVLAELA